MEFFKLTLQDRNPNPLQDAGELEGLEEPTQRFEKNISQLTLSTDASTHQDKK